MRKLLSALLVLAMCAVAQNALAGAPPIPGQGTGAPIDGATGALLVVVAGYGYSRLKKQENKSEVEEGAEKSGQVSN